MTGEILEDKRFAAVIDDEMRQKLTDAETSLNNGKTHLVSEKYSRMVITTGYPEESENTTAFLNDIENFAESNLSGDYYLIGSSAMNHEMKKTFNGEFKFITLLTFSANDIGAYTCNGNRNSRWNV